MTPILLRDIVVIISNALLESLFLKAVPKMIKFLSVEFICGAVYGFHFFFKNFDKTIRRGPGFLWIYTFKQRQFFTKHFVFQSNKMLQSVHQLGFYISSSQSTKDFHNTIEFKMNTYRLYFTSQQTRWKIEGWPLIRIESDKYCSVPFDFGGANKYDGLQMRK